MLIYGSDERLRLDVLAFGPHPDDAEIGAGGALLKLADRGKRTGIIDMTLGEMASGGDVETRIGESRQAAEILGLTVRENLELPDCRLTDNYETRCTVAEAIRRYRPQVVLGPYYDLPPGRGLGHSDHIQGGLLVAHGANYAHLQKLPIEYEPWHPEAVYFYFLPPTLMPSFVIDVTDYGEQWLASIMVHESQFGRPDQNKLIRDYFSGMATRWARWTGGRYAQAFYSPWPLIAEDVLTAACPPEGHHSD